MADEQKTKIRSVTSPPFVMNLPPDGKPRNVYREMGAVYLNGPEDVDTLLKLIVSGSEMIAQFQLKDTGETVVLLNRILPSKIAPLEIAKGFTKK
jgi:hypothetical protein